MWSIKERSSILCIEEFNAGIRTIDLSTGKPLGNRPLKSTRWGKPETAHSEDGTWFVWGDDTGRLELWDMRDFKVAPKTIKANSGTVVGVALSADGDRIVSVGEENMIKVWEAPKKADTSKKPRK